MWTTPPWCGPRYHPEFGATGSSHQCGVNHTVTPNGHPECHCPRTRSSSGGGRPHSGVVHMIWRVNHTVTPNGHPEYHCPRTRSSSGGGRPHSGVVHMIWRGLAMGQRRSHKRDHAQHDLDTEQQPLQPHTRARQGCMDGRPFCAGANTSQKRHSHHPRSLTVAAGSSAAHARKTTHTTRSSSRYNHTPARTPGLRGRPTLLCWRKHQPKEAQPASTQLDGRGGEQRRSREKAHAPTTTTTTTSHARTHSVSTTHATAPTSHARTPSARHTRPRPRHTHAALGSTRH